MKKESIPRNEKTYSHRCGGTLVQRNQPGETDKTTNVIVTAAHCICGQHEIDRQTGKPEPDHWFVRIGLIDNKRALNVVRKNSEGKIIDEDEHKYVDVLVKDIKLKGKLKPFRALSIKFSSRSKLSNKSGTMLIP